MNWIVSDECCREGVLSNCVEVVDEFHGAGRCESSCRTDDRLVERGGAQRWFVRVAQSSCSLFQLKIHRLIVNNLYFNVNWFNRFLLSASASRSPPATPWSCEARLSRPAGGTSVIIRQENYLLSRKENTVQTVSTLVKKDMNELSDDWEEVVQRQEVRVLPLLREEYAEILIFLWVFRERQR